ncbi:hypothetical protein BBK36DRAFT_1138311 [Trichoderma citrinoviride]|uniref:Uncharacterized protein n=1 Tax=Trichoderma citrinoviride TaxID=58853 RepID=A0A2T4BKQ5_9HYPO|nr:hypothetical protein BBK36DRAFT_1138311 [Trichoderma citrinoviride]PTB69898.1 hypothetical protein BBK36DRAFT_1138311 [Trichoderma citrinoviride]
MLSSRQFHCARAVSRRWPQLLSRAIGEIRRAEYAVSVGTALSRPRNGNDLREPDRQLKTRPFASGQKHEGGWTPTGEADDLILILEEGAIEITQIPPEATQDSQEGKHEQRIDFLSVLSSTLAKRDGELSRKGAVILAIGLWLTKYRIHYELDNGNGQGTCCPCGGGTTD